MLAAVLAVIALALVLDRQEPYREPRAASTGAAGISHGREVQRIARRVERIRQLRFERPVRAALRGPGGGDPPAARGHACEDTGSSRAADEEALKLLGLIPAGESLAKAFAAVEREQVLGFYDDSRKRLVVVRDRQASRPLLEITLAHELVHALEDQRFGLRTRAAVSDDAALAETALAEGTATLVMAEYAVRYFGISDALALLRRGGQRHRAPPVRRGHAGIPLRAGPRVRGGVSRRVRELEGARQRDPLPAAGHAWSR